VNTELGTTFAVSIVRVPVNDTRPEAAYGWMVEQILRRIAANEPFEAR
jgi:hypothetical protein